MTEAIGYLTSSIDTSKIEDNIKTSLRHEDIGDIALLRAAISRNYETVSEMFYGEPSICPVVISSDTDQDFANTLIDTRVAIQNYVSSIYSYLESVRDVLENAYDINLSKDVFISFDSEDYRTKFSKRLEIIWGIRTIVQHAGLHCIDLDQVDCNLDGTRYDRVCLNLDKFKKFDWKKPEEEPDRYLRNVHTGSSLLDILPQINDFNDVLDSFHNSVVHVLEENYTLDSSEASDIL